MTPKHIKSVLHDHRNWLHGQGGKRADLRGLDLSGFDLRREDLSWSELSGSNLSGTSLFRVNLHGACLYGADLRDVNFCEANLSEANLYESDFGYYGKYISHAATYGNLHGEQGRQLLAILCTKETVFFCGCFIGTENELRAYIRDGDRGYKKSRLAALKAVKLLLTI